jgi:diaminopimelate epimerase
MTLRFAKYEGLGNDFVVVDLKQGETQVSTQTAAALCDRHRGIGADGVLLVTTHEAAPRMRVINADGSQPEMCGNGLRCVALHLVRRGAAPVGRDFVVETDAGPHMCLVVSSERESSVRVGMRAAELTPAAVPVLASPSEARVLDQPFEVSGAQVRLSCVSMGNPHAVTFDDLGATARIAIAPQLEKHARFPRAANIGFARVIGPQQLELAVWERGVGFTEACGTGACACAVAAVETERAERHRPIEVRLPGGPLHIVVGDRDAIISMTGPARHVFDGTFLL